MLPDKKARTLSSYTFLILYFISFSIITFSAFPVLAKTVELPAPYLDESIIDPPTQGTPLAPSDFKPPNPDNLLIIQLNLGQYQLYDAMPAYLNEGSILLPLSELVRAVDFPINVRPEAATAEGWFLKENQLFSLDVQQGQVVINGKRQSFNPALVGILDDDIFVDARLIAKWFPIDVNIDIPNLLVELESRDPLPVEQRLARQQKRDKLLNKRRKEGSKYASLPIPYKTITWPITDSSMEFNFNQSDDDTSSSFEQTTFITGDIGKLNAEAFFASTLDQNFNQARLKLGRRDPTGHLLGAAKATEFAFGDITSPQVSMVANTQLGRGVLVSNRPLEEPTEFDRITLEGDLPVGWEAELYRNEVLLDFRVSRSDGRYEFQNVPLLFGVNIVRLAFYGPQGQFREEVRQLRVGPDQVKPGEHQYAFAFNQHDRQFLLGNAVDTSDDAIQGRGRVFAEYATGISRNLSISTGFSSVPFSDRRRNYLSLSGRTSIGNVFGRADVVRDLSEGWGIKLASQTNLAGINVIVEHDRLFDFVSEQFESSDDPITHDTSLRLDGAIRFKDFAHVPFSLTTEHTQQVSGDTNTSVSGRVSTAVGAASLTKTLKWQLAKTETDRTTTVDGSWLIGGRIRNIRVRGQLSYNLEPDIEISSSSVGGDWRINERFNASGGIDVSLGDETVTTFSAGLNSNLKYAALGINLSYATSNDISGRMSLSFSSARDPKSPLMPIVSSQRMASNGAMTARVFLDLNSNGKFDKGDKPLEGVQFSIDGTKKPAKTDKDGHAFVTGIRVHTPVDFAVSTGTLEDPFWISQPEGVSVVLRPGVTGHVEFPVVSAGEIDGTVYRRRGDWSDPVADAVVQIVDGDGKVVKETRTAYDGFYLLDFVVPGKYTLRIDPDQIARLKLATPKPQTVEIETDGTVLNGMDFFLDLARKARFFRVLLTSFLSRDAAIAAWKELKPKLPNEFRTLRPMIQLQDMGKDENGKERGVVHNLFVGPLEKRGEGERLCINIRVTKGDAWCNPLTIQAR